MNTATAVTDLASSIEFARAECDREWDLSARATIAATITNDGPAALARAAVHAEKANAAHARAEALAATRTTAPIYAEVDLAAYDVCAAAKYAIIVGGSRIMLLAPTGGTDFEMTSHQHRDIANLLTRIPYGATVRVSFQGAAPRSADAVISALDFAAFKVCAVARHENTDIGRPGKPKVMRDGVLAFIAPASIDDEIKSFANNVVALITAPLLPAM